MPMGPVHIAYPLVSIAMVALTTWGLSELLRMYARRSGLLDVPNERSSHAVPTPRGGGLAIVVCTLLSVMVMNLGGRLSSGYGVPLIAGGGLVALVGALDDRLGLPAYLRLLAHCAAAAIAVGFIGAVGSLSVGHSAVNFGYAAWPLTIVGIVWFLNLFNFMDGIDGIAISQALFMSIAGGALAAINGAPMGLVVAMFVFSASCLGFVPLNWPPARMFMGDVGSGFLGFTLAAFALATVVLGALSVWTWILLSGTFLVDATVTLVRRLVRGEKVYQAHRSHAYQHLSRRWHSHGRVTGSFIAVNIGWLLPLAWLSVRSNDSAPLIVAIGIAPLVAVAWLSGAGRP
jgi:Fuc2NAc and GlcNAc transferase